MLLGPICIALATLVSSFSLALVSIFIIGASLSFGEALLLSHIRHFTPQSVAGYSSGTGLAGVIASLFFLMMTYLKVPLLVTFAAISVLSFAFIGAFFLLRRPPVTETEEMAADDLDAALIGTSGDVSRVVSRRNSMVRELAKHDIEDPEDIDVQDMGSGDQINAGDMALLLDDGEISGTDELDRHERARGGPGAILGRIWDGIKTFFTRVGRAAIICTRYEVQIALVYFFEFAVSTGNAAKAEPIADSHASEDYIALQFAYQFGVLISRSSLPVFKFKWIEVLTALQAVNFVFWNLQSYFKLVPMWVQFPGMLFVGLLGGCMYVNVFYLLMHDTRIPKDLKEISVTLVTLMMTVGISLSCAYTLVADKLWLHDK